MEETQEVIDLADQGKFSEFSTKVRKSLEDKLRDNKALNTNKEKLNKFTDMAAKFKEIAGVKTVADDTKVDDTATVDTKVDDTATVDDTTNTTVDDTKVDDTAVDTATVDDTKVDDTTNTED